MNKTNNRYKLGDICTITKGKTGIMNAIDGQYTMVTLGEENKTHNEYQFDVKAVINPLVSSTGHGHASMKRVKYIEGKFALGYYSMRLFQKMKIWYCQNIYKFIYTKTEKNY